MGGGPKRGDSDKRISTCKQCGAGIFKTDETLWRRTPVIGLIHARCAPPPDTCD